MNARQVHFNLILYFLPNFLITAFISSASKINASDLFPVSCTPFVIHITHCFVDGLNIRCAGADKENMSSMGKRFFISC